MSDALLGTVLNDKYRLDAVLGAGGMGIVYRAAELDNRGERIRDVAVKMIRPDRLVGGWDARVKFLREISAAAQLRGPHAIPVYYFDESAAGQLYYVMELVQGPTLHGIFTNAAPLPATRMVEIGMQICGALDEAHRLDPPLVHRDLKPQNIFVDGWPDRVRVRVGDFGLAKCGEEQTEVTRTPGSTPGTARYMSPEQCNAGPVDARSDLYSLGVIMYEGLSGQTPFAGEGMVAMQQHVSAPPPPLPRTVPPRLRRIVMSLLAKSPDRRPANAAALRNLLATSVEGGPAQRPAMALSASIVALLILLIAGWMLFGSPPPWREPAAADDGRTGIAVFQFKNDSGNDRDTNWLRGFLQSTFSTDLGKISSLRVYSTDLVEESARGDDRPITVARLLGAKKLITGSFTVLNDKIQIAARLVDAITGEQERAESIRGSMNEVFDLQKKLTLAMVSQLPIPVSSGERDAIDKQRPSRNQEVARDALRLMLQGEGLDEEAEDSVDRDDRGSWRWLMPAAAIAQEHGGAEQEIRAILERYRQALEKGDLDGIQTTWGKLSDRRRKGLEEYFAIAVDRKITFDRIEIQALEGDRYAISYVRRDQFSDRRTGEEVNLEVQLVNTAERDGESWRIRNAKRLADE